MSELDKSTTTCPINTEYSFDYKNERSRDNPYMVLYNPEGKIIADTANSEVAEIIYVDEPGKYYDDQGGKDFKRIVECLNAMRGVELPQALRVALLDFKKSYNAFVQDACAGKMSHDCSEQMGRATITLISNLRGL